MRDAYRRTCSHFSTRATMGVPEGTVLRTLLTGNCARSPDSTFVCACGNKEVAEVGGSIPLNTPQSIHLIILLFPRQ